MGSPAAFESLGRRGQIGRLRRLGRVALARYGLADAALAPLRHEHNATFRVDAPGGPYVLRVTRPGVHTPETIASETAWLEALRRDTDLGVPEPVGARDGSLVVIAADPGVPEPRACVLMRHLEGRFVDGRLTTRHLRAVARLTAALHEHARGWSPPAGFERPPVGTLTTPAKAGAIGAEEDAAAAAAMVAELVSPAHGQTFAAALEMVRDTTGELHRQAGAAGLVHADLHQENYLFNAGEASAIDFDDAGQGLFIYDLAVTLSELEGRPRYEQLREALLDEYAGLGSLPEGWESKLEALQILRRIQLLMWVLESRRHPTFRDGWRTWLRTDLDELSARLR
jgi:Ser/Thr protein kinase RdoA (MazF antagonist)